MKLIDQSFEILGQGPRLIDIYKQVELAGRNCYKSELKTTEDSAKSFVDRMVKSNHLAMLEHGTVYLYLEINPNNALKIVDNSISHYIWHDFVDGISLKYSENKYSKVIEIHNGDIHRYYITTNLRVIVENGWQTDLQYLCRPDHHEMRHTVKFTTSNGIMRELTRHRVFSFAVESTRYCNYSSSKFNNEITFIKPYWYNENDPNSKLFEEYLKTAENTYLRLLSNGYIAQQAREVLPLATKCDVVMTGYDSDWYYLFDLRVKGTTGKPHPDMINLVEPVYKEFESWKLIPDDQLLTI